MFDLQGACALVTGASGGIGGAVARILSAQGARVVLSGTRRDALEKLADELKDAFVIPANLSDFSAVKSLFEEAEKQAGEINILVSNAGVTRDSLALRMKQEDWDFVLDVNLKATFLLAQSALRAMIRRRYGRIIGIASVVGVAGNLGQANYAASKAGMIGMFKSLSLEAASRNVTINCVAPGFIETPMTGSLSEGVREKMLASIPVGRFGSPEDVAGAVAYLASRGASYVTGQTLHVNGGMLRV